jgi:hypothetical protein
MSIVISVENHDTKDSFIELEDEQFIELWTFLDLRATSKGSMYGIKMYNIVQEGIKRDGAVYNSKINNMITSMDVIRNLGKLIGKAMLSEDKLIWTYV